IRTTTAPLACLARNPVSRLITFSPMVRSTILRANAVLDMECYLRGRPKRRERIIRIRRMCPVPTAMIKTRRQRGPAQADGRIEEQPVRCLVSSSETRLASLQTHHEV